MNQSNQKNADVIEIVKQQQMKKEFVPFGQMSPYPGHKVFECNVITGEVLIAQYEELPPAYVMQKNTDELKTIETVAAKTISVGKIKMNPDCIYLSALNKKNAIKLLKREHGIEFSLI